MDGAPSGPEGWPTKSQLAATDFSYFGQAADYLKKISSKVLGTFEQLSQDVKTPGGVEWEGAAGEAAIEQAGLDVVRVRSAAWSWDDVRARLPLWQDTLDSGQRLVFDAIDEAERDGFEVGDDYTVTDSRTSYASPAERDARQVAADRHAGFIWHRVATLVGHQSAIDAELKAMTAGWGNLTFPEDGLGGENGKVRPFDHHWKTGGGSDTDSDRKKNQEEAFKQVYGRAPTSASDWEMAAALDPHTYNPDFKGMQSEVRVVRINPVPGQGVVRASQWIPQRDVTSFPPNKRDLGNNRGPDAHFDPENTKVTTYIDYEHGIVVMRQNPSVEENPDGSPGHVKVGVPQGSVTQTPDGAVRIKYDAGNPFAPGPTTNPSGPLGDHRVSVNGDLVFTPGPGGVHVDGTRTNYPSMEIYQDMPNGTTRTVLIDPARSGSSEGPALNLPRHHDIGIGGRAFEPFDRGGWNPRYDVPAPLSPTPFGPVTTPPSVPAPSSGGGVWA